MEYIDPLEQFLGDSEEDVGGPAAFAVLRETGRIAKRVTGKLNRFRELVVEGVFDDIMARRRRLGEAVLLSGVAVDSTYPPEGGVELVGGHLVGVVAGYIAYRGGREAPSRGIMVRALLVEDEDARKRVPIAAKILEKRLALRILDMIEERKLEAKVILFDGELIPYHVLFRRVKGRPLLEHLDAETSRLLERARELRVSLVGVVKRSYSRLLSALVGREVFLNDKAALSMLLDPGSYVELGRYHSLLPRYALISKHGEKLGKLVRERLGERPVYGEVTVAFYRPIQGPGYAVKTEILDYGDIGIGEILSSLAAMTNPGTGLPYPIDLVDEYTRFEARVLELLRRRLIAELADELGPSVAIVLSHTNPEKRYLYEPRRIGRHS